KGGTTHGFRITRPVCRLTNRHTGGSPGVRCSPDLRNETRTMVTPSGEMAVPRTVVSWDALIGRTPAAVMLILGGTSVVTVQARTAGGGSRVPPASMARTSK